MEGSFITMKHDWRARRCRNVETLLIIFRICSVLMLTLTKQTTEAPTKRMDQNEALRFSFVVFDVTNTKATDIKA